MRNHLYTIDYMYSFQMKCRFEHIINHPAFGGTVLLLIYNFREWDKKSSLQSSFTVQNLRTPLAKIGHVIRRYLATQHVSRALLSIMHGKRALFKFQNGNRGSELRLYIKSVRDLKFLFCLRIHALANRRMNSKFSIINSASPRSLLNFSFIVRLARACIHKQNTHNEREGG